MARLFTAGAESGHAQAEGMTLGGGGITFDTSVKRSGTASFKSTASTQTVARALTGVLDRTYFARFYLRVDESATPATAARFFLITGAATNPLTLEVTTANKIRLYDRNLVAVATGSVTLVSGQWYRIEVKVTVPTAGNGSAEVKVDGVADIALVSFDTGNSAINTMRFGWNVGSGTNITAIYVDDIAINDDQGSDQNSYPGPGNVYLLTPASDPGTGTSNGNWTKPAGSTSNRNTSVDNNPPIYIADSTASGDAEKILRNPTNAASQLELDVTDYTTAGIPSTDIITLVTPVAGTGSSSATDTGGDFGVLSNPAGSQKTMTTFDNGVASTTATTWPTFFADPIYTPTPTRGTKPRLRLSRNAAARTVMTNFMGLLVETVTPVIAAAALTGTGSLSASATRTRTAAAALTGTGSLSAAGQHTAVAAAALTGAGTLSAAATRTRFGAAALTGTGSLSAAATRATFAAAALTGTGTLAATATLTTTAAATLTGTGSLTGTATRTRLGAAALTGTGTLSASAESGATATGAADLTGTGTLTATASIVFFGPATGHIDQADVGHIGEATTGHIDMTTRGVTT